METPSLTVLSVGSAMEEWPARRASIQDSVVRLVGADGGTLGSGFLVHEGALLVTCNHVIKDLPDGSSVPFASRPFVLPGRQPRTLVISGKAQVEKSWRAPAYDVAVLKVTECKVPKELELARLGLDLGSSKNLEVGGALRTFGFPVSKPVDGLPSVCYYTGEATEDNTTVLTVHCQDATFGFSGAPAWDPKLGVVVGLFTSILNQAQTAFLIPIETVREVCQELALSAECPYKSLDAFGADSAAYYFGRDETIKRLVAALSKHRLVTLLGASGSGKSSLVRAGLTKALKLVPKAMSVLTPMHVAVPATDPLRDLMLSLGEPYTTSSGEPLADDTRAVLGATERPKSEALCRVILELLRRSGVHLLVIDQFERVFTNAVSAPDRDEFAALLLRVVETNVKVCVVLRADFYGDALELKGLDSHVAKAQLTVLAMTDDELQESIVLPARALHRSYQPGLAETLTSEVRGRAGDLPLLQFALTELWKADAKTGVLRTASYENLSTYEFHDTILRGTKGLIVRRAEEVWAQLPDRKHAAAMRVFLSLARSSAAGFDTGRLGVSTRAWESELGDAEVVSALADSFLVTRSFDAAAGQATIEVAHEALLTAWPRLQGWLKEHDAFIGWLDSDLRPYFRKYERNQQKSFLLPEPMLEMAKAYAASDAALLERPLLKYIQESIEHHKRVASQDQRNARFTRLLLVLVVVCVCLVFFFQNLADATRASDLHARALSAISEKDFASAEALLARAVGIHDEARLRERLLDARLQTPLIRATFQPIEGKVKAVSRDGRYVAAVTENELFSIEVVDLEHTVRWSEKVAHPVSALAFSETGSALFIATEGQDNALLVDLPRGETTFLPLPKASVVAGAAICGSDKLIAFGDQEGRLWMRTPNTGAFEQIQRNGSTNRLAVLAFNADCSALTAAGSGPVVNTWLKIEGWHIPHLFAGHTDDVMGITFSPGGDVVSASADGTIRFSNSRDGVERERLVGHRGDVNAVAVSDDNRRVVSGSSDGTAKLWDRASGAILASVNSRSADIRHVGFTAGHNSFFATDSNGLSVVWETVHDREVTILEAPGTVSAVAFHPTQPYIASVGDDQPDSKQDPLTRKTSVYLWDPTRQAYIRRFVGAPSTLLNVAFSPDGKVIAAAARSGDVLIWDYETGKPMPAPPRHTNEAWGLMFDDRDGELLLISGGRDSVLKAWSVTHSRVDWEVKLPPNGLDQKETEIVLALALDSRPKPTQPRTLAVAGNKVHLLRYERSRWSKWTPGRVLDWGSAKKSDQIAVFGGDRGFWGAAFDQDMATFIAGSSDRHVHFFAQSDLRWSEQPAEVSPPSHEGSVTSVTFCNRWMASGGLDGAVRLWDAKKKTALTLHSHHGPIWWVSCSPDGTRLASGGVDGRVSIYSMEQLEHTLSAPAKQLLDEADSFTWLTMNEDGELAMKRAGQQAAPAPSSGTAGLL